MKVVGGWWSMVDGGGRSMVDGRLTGMSYALVVPGVCLAAERGS